MSFDSFISKVTNARIIFIVLVFASVIPYLNIIGNEFAYDDPYYFVEWEGIRTVDFVSFFAGDQPLNYRHVYRPVRSIIMALVYQIGGTNPTAYHIFSMLIHITNVLLVYIIAKKISTKLAAFIAAIIFAVLPVHVESVAFVTASFNTMGVAILLLSFCWYIVFRELNKSSYIWASVIAALIAYFSYELTLILPLLIICYDLCIRNATLKDLGLQFKFYSAYIAGAVGFFLLRSAILNSLTMGEFLTPLSFFTRMLTMSKALIYYMYLVIVNAPLSVSQNLEISTSLADVNVVLALLGLVFIAFLAFYFFKKEKKLYTFLILWFFISLLPVANIIQIASFVSEQYVYLASFAWAFLVGVLGAHLIARQPSKKALPIFVFFVFLCLAFLYGSATWARNAVWKSDEILWQTTLAQYPANPKAYNNLGLFYIRNKDTDRARDYFEKAVELFPNYSLAHINLGQLYLEQKHYDEAVTELEKAISLNPREPTIYNNLGVTYMSVNNIDKAEENFKKAIELSPDYAESHFNLAVIYIGKEEFDRAISHFKNVVRLTPKEAEAHFGVGLAYMGLRQPREALPYIKKALELNPSFEPAQQMLRQIQQELK